MEPQTFDQGGMNVEKGRGSSSNSEPVMLKIKVSDVEFNTITYRDFPDEFHFTPELHSHGYVEVLTAINGVFQIDFLNSPSVEMTPNMVCVIPSNCHHSTKALSPDAAKLAIRFSYHQTKPKAEYVPVYEQVDRMFEQTIRPVVMEADIMTAVMKSLRIELGTDEFASDISTYVLLQQFYIHLLRSMMPEVEKQKTEVLFQEDDNRRYYRIEQFLSERYAEQITADDLAETLGLSKRQLDRAMKELFNSSFRQELIKTRLSKAAKLLAKTDVPIEQIAEMVGYTSVTGFYIAFKKTFGVASSEYRKQNRVKG